MWHTHAPYSSTIPYHMENPRDTDAGYHDVQMPACGRARGHIQLTTSDSKPGFNPSSEFQW